MTDGLVGSWAARWRPEIVLAALVLVVAGPIVQVLMAHQASRLAFTGALVDRGTVQIDAYAGPDVGSCSLPGRRALDGGIVAVDFAERDCVIYSDKAPGQPALAAAPYALARAVGAEPAETQRSFGNLTLWWTSLWSSVVPLAALAVMMRRVALQVVGREGAATAAAVGLSMGSLLLPFSTVLFGHVLTAALCFAAYLLGRAPDASWGRLAAAGALGGAAVLTEYAAGIVVAAVGLLVLWRRGPRVLAYVAGGLPAVAVLAVYNAAAWGSPTQFSYDNSGSFEEFHAQGLFGIRIPSPSLTAQVLVGERGLLTLTPIVLVGVIGLVALARDRATREVGLVGLGVFTAFVAVQGGWFSVTAGASPGPRYVVPALPFVAVGVARIWQDSRVGVIAAGVIGTIPMLMAIFTNPLAQPTETFTAGHWAWRIATGRWGDTLLTPYLGSPWAQLVQLAAAGAVLALLVRVTADRDRRAVPTERPLG
jgi:4-amino-4-deoxy-L-arabinose transferase-like glycosyltransferase